MKTADLHLHTNASDGSDTLEKRLEQAKNLGIDCIAITDHDTVNPELKKRSKLTENGVELITGAEIGCKIGDSNIEILGYFLNPEGDQLQKLFNRIEQLRQNRMREMVEKLDQELETDLKFRDVKELADGTVGRPHLAQALVKKEVVENQNQAFKKHIGSRSQIYVETEKPSSRKVIETIHENGGVTSLAHPGRDLEKTSAEKIVGELVNQGLDAVEVPYTYKHKRREGYDIKFGVKKSREIAKQYNLPITGGSDCHGEKTNKHNIGKVKLPYRHVEKLRKLAGQYRNNR